MNWDQVEGKWKQYKGKVKEKWGKFTDDDLTVINGRSQQLVGKDSGAIRNRERRRGKTSRRIRQESQGRSCGRKRRAALIASSEWTADREQLHGPRSR